MDGQKSNKVVDSKSKSDAVMETNNQTENTFRKVDSFNQISKSNLKILTDIDKRDRQVLATSYDLMA